MAKNWDDVIKGYLTIFNILFFMIDDRFLFSLSIFKILQQASRSFKQSDDNTTGINRKGFVNVSPESTTKQHRTNRRPQNLHPSPRISFASTKSRADPQILTNLFIEVSPLS